MRYLLLLSLLILSACGFSPVYGTHSNSNAPLTGEANLSNVEIALIPNREGQFLRNALIDRFYTNGTPNNAAYTLKISPIRENIFDFDITIDSEATRRQLRLNTQMSLIDKETNKVVLKNDLLSIASFNVLESEFSTIVTEQSARDNALNDLARKAERQLALFFTK